MLKILYASGNNQNSKVQLWRFHQAMQDDTRYQIKIAAYKKSSPNINIDWTLDALINPNRLESLSLNNDNVHVYYEQIKTYSPDIIISDLEYFSSYIASLLNITLWQCSSMLIHYALTHKSKYNAGMSNQYLSLLKLDSENHQKILNIITNSNRNFVYSHFGDVANAPELKDGFEWIRPYHLQGKPYKPCQHNIVAGMLNNNRAVIDILKKQKDCVVFSEFPNESHPNITMKSIWDSQDYYCNIYNSPYFVCEGQTSFLADAFYSNKHSIIFPNYKDIECVTNTMYSNHLGLSKSYHINKDIELAFDKEINIQLSDSIHFLHEKIEAL